jgi:hypothetical protein
VPDISGSAALDVLIGLFFLYFLLSIVCSAINEGIAAVFRLRARYLERGLRTLLGRDANVRAFYSHWRMRALIKPPGRFFKAPRKPSYISSRAFALTLLDTFAPPGDATDSRDLIGRATKALGPPGDEESSPPPEIVRGLLRDALDETRVDIDRFRSSIERSFDEVMDRVSGWYKRRVQLILFVLGVALASAMNADSFVIGQRLWKDPALRNAVVAQASNVVEAGGAKCAKTNAKTTKADAAAKCIDEVKQFGLPLGWNRATSPHDFRGGLGKVLGLLVTGFALSLGAPFWFDLLGKVSNLRGSGPASPGAESKATGSQPPG